MYGHRFAITVEEGGMRDVSRGRLLLKFVYAAEFCQFNSSKKTPVFRRCVLVLHLVLNIKSIVCLFVSHIAF